MHITATADNVVTSLRENWGKILKPYPRRQPPRSRKFTFSWLVLVEPKAPCYRARVGFFSYSLSDNVRLIFVSREGMT